MDIKKLVKIGDAVASAIYGSEHSAYVNAEVGKPYRYKGWYVVCINYDRGDATYLIATDKSQVENADEWVGFEKEEDAEAFEIAGNEGLDVEDPDEFYRFYEVSVASSADIDNE